MFNSVSETLQKAREELAEEVQISRFVALHHQIHIFFDGLLLLRKAFLEVLAGVVVSPFAHLPGQGGEVFGRALGYVETLVTMEILRFL